MWYWKLNDNSAVESHDNNHIVPNAHEITEQEYIMFIENLPPSPPPAPVRNLTAELDALKQKLVDKGILLASEI